MEDIHLIEIEKVVFAPIQSANVDKKRIMRDTDVVHSIWASGINILGFGYVCCDFIPNISRHQTL